MLSVRDAERVAARFGLGGEAVLAGPVARGELGQVWRIETDRGRWAVKEPFEPPSVDEATDDAMYQDAVGASGVSMPAIVWGVDGRVLADIGTAVVRVYEWVDLLPLDRRLDPVAVGHLVASITASSIVGRGPVHLWYTDPVGAPRWDELATELAAAGAPFAATLAAHRDELVAVEQLLESPSDLQTCHCDLFADNILRRAESLARSGTRSARTAAGPLCVIDWENSGLADPSQELAIVVVEFACGDPVRARRLYRAHLEADGPGRIERPGHFSMAIAQLGHLGELACRRWLDVTYDRARSTARVREFLGEPMTRQLIDGFLAALTSDR